MSVIKEMLNILIGLVFPKRCPCCDRVTYDNEDICSDCRLDLLKMKLPLDVCKKCGLPKDECTCKKRVYLFKGIAAPFRYEGAAAKGVLNVKKLKSFDNAEYFSRYIANRVKHLFGDVKFDFICNVPMYKAKEQRVGFNHTKVLAERVGQRLGIEYKDVLVQVKENKSQHELKRSERVANVKGIYEAKLDIFGSKVLLLDDIKTSGASLDECARQLLLAGADEVWCCTIAVVCKKTL